MKKYLFILLALGTIAFPTLVSAKETNNDKELLAQTTKYIKTITEYDKLSAYAYSSNTVNHTKSYSVEVSEDEYNNAKETTITTNGSGSVETTYKKMTTSIFDSGSYKTFQVELNWKTMPAVRSFDIIAIGMYTTVKLRTSTDFKQYYCVSGGSCYTSQTHTPRVFSTGAGGTFQLMTGGLSTLRATLSFDVIKNVSSTIYGLDAYGDYSHATSTLSNSSAQNYNVSSGGIELNSSISGYYDSIQSAHATWSGNW